MQPIVTLKHFSFSAFSALKICTTVLNEIGIACLEDFARRSFDQHL